MDSEPRQVCSSTTRPKNMVFILYDYYCWPLLCCVCEQSCVKNKIMILHYDNSEQALLCVLQLSPVSFISLMGFVVKQALLCVLQLSPVSFISLMGFVVKQALLCVLQLSPVSFISLMGFVVKVTFILGRFVYKYFRCLNIIPFIIHPSSSLILLLPEKI